MQIPDKIFIAPADAQDQELIMLRAVGLLKKVLETKKQYERTLGVEARRIMRKWEDRSVEFLNEINKPR